MSFSIYPCHNLPIFAKTVDFNMLQNYITDFLYSFIFKYLFFLYIMSIKVNLGAYLASITYRP